MNETLPQIVVDGCILQAAGDRDKNKSKAVAKCLADLELAGHKLIVSDYTGYERTYGLQGEKLKAVVEAVDHYEQKAVTKLVFIYAALFAGIYRDFKVDCMDDGDKILQATAFLEKALILTENHEDFPNPFYSIEKELRIDYIVGGRNTKTLIFAIYKPNYSLITKLLSERLRGATSPTVTIPIAPGPKPLV